MKREGWVYECAGEYIEKYIKEYAEDYIKA